MSRRPRLTYANVVATLALFVALGGASYAAVELPAGSVGSKQLRAGSVTQEKLAFSIGATGMTDWTTQELPKADGCNAPRPPGAVGVVSCPDLEATGHGAEPGFKPPFEREQTIRLSHPGQLMVSGAAQLRNKGPAGSWASVTAAIVVDHVVIVRPKVKVEGDSSTEMPLDGVVNVGRGIHHFFVVFEASYSSYLPGEVRVAPVTLWAAALPR
jgi:hypothetical protein